MWTQDRREYFRKDVAKEVTKFYINKKIEASRDAKKAVSDIVKTEAGHMFRHSIKGRKYFYF